MDWFLHDNGLRHERVKQLYIVRPNNITFCDSLISTLS